MPNRKNKVILLVEPEQRLSPLKLVLEAEQYNVITADNLNNVEHLISRHPVNAVLIDADAKAEQYDCRIVAKSTKQERPEVPVIILSTRDWIAADYCEGADYHMAKSSSPVEMIRAFEKLMGDTQPEVHIAAGNGNSHTK